MKKTQKTETKAIAKEAPADNNLLVEERRRHIRELVAERGRITVAELVTMFDISQVTVRSDLNALAEIGAVVRTRGGALAQRADEDLPIGVKQTLRRAEKMRIAEAAVQLIGEGQTIVLDSGTTTAEIAKQIRGLKLQSINVITNALNIAVLLAGAPHVTLIMLGGVLRPSSYSLGGPQAEAALQGLHADILFLGFDGLDPEIGVMTPHLLEARLNSRMLEIARSVVAVGDSSKLGRRSLSVIAKIEQVDRIITDAGAAPETVEALRARGAQVVLV
ncbi:transcriptional regulator, DeoR family [Duganella sp. CF517]|uniref:DeoR/GlpR family DNA-binding transcription regulator n=1 Tax=Duganella sp. CF517 TaxID=1881038 RepID=UPI0008B2A519|nr:DeoR/GlpR family DNA-binding transcription regulator [Duganella sp. CF517]SEN07244.1 transcriptional regulator, DeoR family [Duganella sp. CF517]